MTECDVILDEVAGLWSHTRAGHRDGMIAVGRRLHAYVEARLAAGSGLNEAQRRAAGATREAATRDAGARLGIPVAKVNELVRVGVAADLLAPPAGWGAASYAFVRALRVLIHRPHKGVPTARTLGDDGPPAADKEVWAVRPDALPWAAALVARGVSEGWSEARVAREARRARFGDSASTDAHGGSAPRPGGPLLSTGAVARILHVAPRTASKMIDSGLLPGWRVPGSDDRRAPRVEVERLARAHGIPTGARLGPPLAFALDGPAPAGAVVFDSAFEFGAAVQRDPPAAAYVGCAEGVAAARAAVRFLARLAVPRVVLELPDDVADPGVDVPPCTALEVVRGGAPCLA